MLLNSGLSLDLAKSEPLSTSETMYYTCALAGPDMTKAVWIDATTAVCSEDSMVSGAMSPSFQP